MDPNATLNLLIDACQSNDRDEAIEALDNLREWISRGGFLPTIIADGPIAKTPKAPAGWESI